jgi:hypothetical protein
VFRPIPLLLSSLSFFTAHSTAAVLTFDALSAANNAATRSTWLSTIGIASPSNLVDFESGFTNGENVSGTTGLFPDGLVFTDTSAANQAVIRSGAGVIGGSNPVGVYSLTQNEQPYLQLDFPNPVDYLGFLGIDHFNGTAIVTFVGGGTSTVSFSITAGSGNSAQFYGIYRNDQPAITRFQIGNFAGGDGTWGIDNVEFGTVAPEPSTIHLIVLAGIALLLICNARRRKGILPVFPSQQLKYVIERRAPRGAAVEYDSQPTSPVLSGWSAIRELSSFR